MANIFPEYDHYLSSDMYSSPLGVNTVGVFSEFCAEKDFRKIALVFLCTTSLLGTPTKSQNVNAEKKEIKLEFSKRKQTHDLNPKFMDC